MAKLPSKSDLAICGSKTEHLGETTVIAVDPRIEYAHFVNFHPGDGQVCEVNPPRFSWGYDPAIIPKEDHLREMLFTLQLSKCGDFAHPDLEINGTPYNFYNALPVLDQDATWHWRVGYCAEREVVWSAVRTFTFEPGAVEWDRTVVDRIGDYLKGHPRVPFSEDQWEEVRSLHKRNSVGAEIRDYVIAQADKVQQRDWWDAFPEGDQERYKGGTTRFEGSKFYAGIGRGLETVAFAYKLTGDEAYAGVRERILKMASWPPGGFSSPEGMGLSDAKNSTWITGNLSLYFDWFYHELTDEERRIILHSIRWRLEHNVRHYSWKKDSLRGIGVFSSSHAYEDFLWTLPGALATYEHLPESREAIELGLHYLMGVTNPFGSEEAWNEGMAYGGWKLATLLDTALYFHFTVPALHIERNPYWKKIGDFFSWLSPLGITSCSFGNQGHSMHYIRAHNANFRKLAFLTGDGCLLQNWKQCHTWEGKNLGYPTPPIDYAICSCWKDTPQQAIEADQHRLFPVAGWAMANTKPPSDATEYRNAVGMIYHCRPRGGYSHSFFSENAFDIFAYGELLANGGGGTENRNPFARSTMSHNSILVDGVGQYQDKLDPAFPWAGRVIAYRKTPTCVYWAGDATRAYQKTPYLLRAIRHILFVRARYFVIFDDLAVRSDHDPARFSWLYHVRQDVPVKINDAGFQYRVGDTCVRVVQAAPDLEIHNMRIIDGYKNVITGEDMSQETYDALHGLPRPFDSEVDVKIEKITANNIWMTNGTPTTEHTFLSAILPWRATEEEPSFERISDTGFRVVWPDSVSDTISFGQASEGCTIHVDFESIRARAKLLEDDFLSQNRSG